MPSESKAANSSGQIGIDRAMSRVVNWSYTLRERSARWRAGCNSSRRFWGQWIGGTNLGILALIVMSLLPATPVWGALVLQIGRNFRGATYGVDSQAIPADANGAVGPQTFVEFVNGRFSVYRTSDAGKLQTMTDLAFWVKTGIPLRRGLIASDPRVVFDAESGRWFASGIDLDQTTTVSNRFLLAVSANGDPTGSWSGFAIPTDPQNGYFGDFPTLGVDSRAVYLAADLFDANGNPRGSSLVSFPKSGLLADPPTVAGRTDLGMLSYAERGDILQPVVAQGTASSDEFVLAVGDVGVDFQPHSNLVCFDILNADQSRGAMLGAPTTLTVPPYVIPLDPLQPGSAFGNLGNDDARFSAIVYRINDLVYAVHTIQQNGRSALQWFKIAAPTHRVIQTGIIRHDQLDLFYPSIAANGDGTVIIACNASSSSSFVSSYAVLGETFDGTLTFGSPTLLQAGSATYQYNDASGLSRWGDYSATSVSPSDPNRFWTVQTIPTSQTVWSTEITELIATPVELSVTSTGHTVELSWPAAATGFQLQHASEVSGGASWSTVTQTPSEVNGRFSVQVPATQDQGFFRLVRQ